MPQRIKFSPTTNIIAAKINSRLGIKAAMSELVEELDEHGVGLRRPEPGEQPPPVRVDGPE